MEHIYREKKYVVAAECHVASKLISWDYVLFLNIAGVDIEDDPDGHYRDAMRNATEALTDGIRHAKAMYDEDLVRRKNGARETFKQAFLEAGLDPVCMKEIPNQYSNDPCYYGRPWFIVTCELGHVKIGRLKKGFKIDVKYTDLHANLGDLFATEDVTASMKYVHAWSYAKMVEYLRVLKESWESQKGDR